MTLSGIVQPLVERTFYFRLPPRNHSPCSYPVRIQDRSESLPQYGQGPVTLTIAPQTSRRAVLILYSIGLGCARIDVTNNTAVK